MRRDYRTRRAGSDFEYDHDYGYDRNYGGGYPGESIPPPPPVPPPGRPRRSQAREDYNTPYESRQYERTPRRQDYDHTSYDSSPGDRYYDQEYGEYNPRGRERAMSPYPPPPPVRPRPRGRAQPRSRYMDPRGVPGPNYSDYDDYPPPKRSDYRPSRDSHYRNEQYDEPDDYRKPSSGSKKPTSGAKTPPTQGTSSGGSRTAMVVIGVIFLLLVLYLFRGPILNALENPDDLSLTYHEYPEGLDFTVRKSMTLTVDPTRQNSYISYKLKSACPKDKFFQVDGENFYLQDMKKVTPDPEPSNGVPNINNQEQWVMLWEESHFTGTRTFVIEYTITTRFFQWELDSENTGSISDISSNLKQNYNHDEWRIDLDHDGFLDNDYGNDDDIDDDGQWDYMIEPTHPGIKKLANQLAGGETNVYNAVKKIYDHLTSDEVLNYETSSQGLPKACSITLTDPRGDCDDYSILFVSLCRALDIPAWLELGVLYDRQTKTWGGHAWAKVAIPLVGGGYSAPAVDIVNKQFMIFDPYRFIEWVDTGGDDFYPGEDSIRNNLDYYYHTFSFIATGRPDVTSPNTNNFMTVSIEEFGEKQRVAADGGNGLDTCMVPGFEISITIPAIIFLVLFFNVNNPKKSKKRRNR